MQNFTQNGHLCRRALAARADLTPQNHHQWCLTPFFEPRRVFVKCFMCVQH